MEAYCVKCKAKKEMKNPVEGVTKNGRIIYKDKCPDCGTTINRIGGAAKKDQVSTTTAVFSQITNMAYLEPQGQATNDLGNNQDGINKGSSRLRGWYEEPGT